MLSISLKRFRIVSTIPKPTDKNVNNEDIITSKMINIIKRKNSEFKGISRDALVLIYNCSTGIEYKKLAMVITAEIEANAFSTNPVLDCLLLSSLIR